MTMARAQHTTICGLDVGSTQTRALVAAWSSDRERLEVVGVGTVPSRGVRKGGIVNLEEAGESIRQAVEEAEQSAGIDIEDVHVGLSGLQAKGYNTRGVVAISRRNREITAVDIRRVLDQACSINLPSDREIIDVLPQEFSVDDQDGITDPLGMLGMRLEAAVHIVTAPLAVKQNIVTSVNHSGMIVADLTLGALAAAEATLTEEEREYGVALINIGGELTSLAIFQRGALRHTSVFPLGGNHFTNDIAVGLRTPVPEAERIKRSHGCSFSPLLGAYSRESIPDLFTVGGRTPITLSRQILCEILQPRAQEVFEHIQDEIQRSGFERQLSSGLVLTGGGSLLAGVPEAAEHYLGLPVRLGRPLGHLAGVTDDIATPDYASVIGLVLHAVRNRQAGIRSHRGGKLSGWSPTVRRWLAAIKAVF